MSTARLNAGKGKGVPIARGRVRRAAVIDTDTLSYERTDPFTALNVLRKLLASLPARIGGCQYKLSADEHRLSMHLLAIVEPFVGLSPSRRTLTRQPTEILDAIVFHLDSKRDLLALALSCQRMHSIIFPRHYEYRVIRCKVSSLSVWNHLIVHRGVARNIRRLEILDERATEAELVPSDILTTDTDLESTDDGLGMHAKHERFLVAALARMSALDTLIWSCNHSLVSVDNVWPELLKCHSLKRIDINDNIVFSPPLDNAGGNSKTTRQQTLRDLRTIGLHSTKHAYGATKNPDMARISTMLNHCPNLEALTVEYSPRRGAGYFNPIADDFLLCGRWPQLRTLVLTNLYCSPHAGFDAAAAFLFAHANVEVLHLDMTFGAGTPGPGGGTAAGRLPLTLAPNSLPRLRELTASKDVASAVLCCPCASARPLETIKGVRLSGSAWDAVFFAALRAHGAGVKRVELAGWRDMDDLRRLAECAPQLAWLDIGRRAAAPAASAGASKPAPPICTNIGEWAALLAQMPALATFHGARFFYEVAVTDASAGAPLSLSDRSRARKNDEAAARLASKCMRLRRVDHWDEGAGKVIVLLRDGDKVRYEVRRVKA